MAYSFIYAHMCTHTHTLTGKKSFSGGGGPMLPGGGGGGSSGGSSGGSMMGGGLFAGGMPRLRPAGSQLLAQW